MSKVMVISYNAVSVGGEHVECHQVFGNVDVYVGEAGLSVYQWAIRRRVAGDDRFEDVLTAVEDVYVYYGVRVGYQVLALLEKLKSMGKTVHVVVCECLDGKQRQSLVDLGAEIVESECGGYSTLGEIIARLS